MNRSYWPGWFLAVAAAGSLATAAPGGPLRPDLIVDANDLATEWTVGFRYFPPGHCAIQEGCIGGPGLKRLLVFTVKTANISQADLLLGDPVNSPFFSYDECHGHYHLDDFSTYELRDASGALLQGATKTDWCLIDVVPYLNEPWVPPSAVHSSCSDQGISPGWADVYHHGLDCQWVDVTGLPAGPYTLSATVNPARKIREADFDNNTSTVQLTLPDPAGEPDLTIVASLTSPTIKLVKRFVQKSEPDVLEGCLTGGSYRRFFTFETHVANLAPYDFYIGDVGAHPMVAFDASHGHYHFEDFLSYEIRDPATGDVLATTRQEYWFPSDWSVHVAAPWVRPDYFYYWFQDTTFLNPGIQRGWRGQAVRPTHRCQVLDVTGLPNGPYQLRMTVNPQARIPESDLTNNAFTKSVTISNPLDGIGHRPDGWLVPGAPLRVEAEPGGLRVVYEVGPSACPVSDFNLYTSIQPPAAHTYDSAYCDIGTSGDVVLPIPDPPPGGMIWMILVGRDGPREGGHGFDSARLERPLTGISRCGVTESVPRPPCL